MHKQGRFGGKATDGAPWVARRAVGRTEPVRTGTWWAVHCCCSAALAHAYPGIPYLSLECTFAALAGQIRKRIRPVTKILWPGLCTIAFDGRHGRPWMGQFAIRGLNWRFSKSKNSEFQCAGKCCHCVLSCVLHRDGSAQFHTSSSSQSVSAI